MPNVLGIGRNINKHSKIQNITKATTSIMQHIEIYSFVSIFLITLLLKFNIFTLFYI